MVSNSATKICCLTEPQKASPCFCIKPQVSNNCYHFILVQYCWLPQLKHYILYLDTSCSPNQHSRWALLTVATHIPTLFPQLLGRCIASWTWFSSKYIFYIYIPLLFLAQWKQKASLFIHFFTRESIAPANYFAGGLVNNGAILREMNIKTYKIIQ